MMWSTKALILTMLLGIFLSYQKGDNSVKVTVDFPIHEESEIHGQVLDSIYVARDLKIYNDVLNDLIKNHFYSRYISEEYDKMYSAYGASDTMLINKQQKESLKKLMADRSNLCTLYINLIQGNKNENFDLDFDPNTKFGEKVSSFLKEVGGSLPQKLKYLRVRQQLFDDKDFYSPIAKISAIHDNLRTHNYELDNSRRGSKNCKIGIVSLSNIIMNNKRNNGVLYYEFYCGSRCAKGELAEIKKVQGKWKIMRTLECWIS